MKTILTAGCTAMLLAMAGPARADSVTFQFSGTVTQVSADPVFGDITFGEAFTGSLSFDSTATDLIPDDPTVGSYAFSSPFGMSVRVGSHGFYAFGSLNIEILNSAVDQYTAFASSQAGDLNMSLFLLDDTGTALDDDHLPPGMPTFNSFAERDFQLSGFLNGGGIQIDGEISAPSLQAVPEPRPLIPGFAFSVVLLALGYRLVRNRSAYSASMKRILMTG